MSKSKKLFSIALAVLLALQLLLIPTFAEGETATGKYTTADNLPLIYGAGVSVEDFEGCAVSETEGSFNFANNDVTDSSVKVLATNTEYNGKYSVVENSAYAAKGTKAFKANGERAYVSFVLNLNENITDLKNLGSVAFYIDMPKGDVTVPETDTKYSSYPDGKYGLAVELKNERGNNTNGTRLTKYDVTYYFKDGTKLVKQDESGLYPYNADGTVSTTGFEGYVSIDVKSSEQYSTLDLDTNFYMGIKTTVTRDWGPGWTKVIYFDDFRVLNSEYFVPYAYQDFEALTGDTVIQNNWQMPYKVYCKDVAKTDNTSENVSYSVDANGIAQGKNSMKIAINGTRGNFRMAIGLTKTGSPFNTTDYNGVAFYVSIPAGQKSKIEVALYNQYEWGTKKSLNAVYTYWFEDGSVLVKYGDDGIYPYDKNGNKSANGFNGYVSVYYGDCSLTDYPYLQLRGPDWNSSLQNKSIYIDDIRPCNFNVVEDIVSGDAYYIGNNAIPVQKVGDTATLSVMTNLAKLGMARNADGIEALRNVMLGYTTAADKHNVNGIDGTDIRDLVALYNLAV